MNHKKSLDLFASCVHASHTHTDLTKSNALLAFIGVHYSYPIRFHMNHKKSLDLFASCVYASHTPI